MKVLNIVEAAYRGTLEEQDDPIIWICSAMKGANADIDVLLRGNAVNYAIKAQNAGGLSIGGQEQTQPPKIADDLVRLRLEAFRVEELADRAPSRPVAPRHRLVHHHDLARALDVVLADRASLHDGDTDHAEVVGPDGDGVDLRRVVLGAVMAADPDPLHVDVGGEG